MKITGTSSSGLATTLVVDDPRVCFDIGTLTPMSFRCRTVLVSHAHMDHIAAAPQHAMTRKLIGAPPSRFIVGAETAPVLEALMSLWETLQGPLPYEMEVIQPGQEILLKGNYFVEAFATSHRVPSIGFAITQKTRTLKPEFQGFAKIALRGLRAGGAETHFDRKDVKIVYTGDTTIEGLDNPLVRDAEVLITECTFVGDYPVAKAREKGHIHLDELRDVLPLLKAKQVVLAHLSQRHRAQEAKDALPDDPRVELFLGEGGPVRW